MFIPYRVIQIKSKEKNKILHRKQPIFKFCDPMPSSLAASLQTIAEIGQLHKSESVHARKTISTTRQRTYRPATSVLRKNQQNRDRAMINKNRSVTLQKQKQSKSNKEQFQSYRSIQVQKSQRTKVNTEEANTSRRKERSKVEKRNEQYCCFNFSINLKEKNSDKNQEKNRYGHRSLDLVQSYYREIKQKQRKKLIPQNQEIKQTKNYCFNHQNATKINEANKFALSEFENLKKIKFGDSKYNTISQKQPNSLQIESKILESDEIENISKPKMKFLDTLYDTWKNSHRMHVTGKTIRNWPKKSPQKKKEEPKDRGQNKEQNKLKAGKKKEDQNKIDAWKENQQLKDQQEFLDYDNEFTMGNEEVYI